MGRRIGGHHGGGNQRPLSDRFKLAGGWGAGADAAMKKISVIAVEVGANPATAGAARNCACSILRGRRAPRAARGKLKRAYGKLLTATSRVVGQAKRFAKEIAKGVKRSRDIVRQLALEGLKQQLDEMVPRVQQVMKQARARIFRGDTRAGGKFSVCSSHRRKSSARARPPSPTSRKGQAAGGGKPNSDDL